METIIQIIKLGEYASKAYKFLGGFRKMGIFKRFKIESRGIAVFPKDAEIGKERRVLIELRIKAKLFKSLDEPIRIANVVLRVPESRKSSFFWKYVSNKKPCKWKWNDMYYFDALTLYEAQKQARGMGGRYLCENDSIFFPLREGQIIELYPGDEWEAIFVFDIRVKSPYNKPLKLCFYDDYEELIDCKVIFLHVPYPLSQNIS